MCLSLFCLFGLECVCFELNKIFPLIKWPTNIFMRNVNLSIFFSCKSKKVLFKAETGISHVNKTIDNSSQKCILSSLFYHILKSVMSLKFTKKLKSSLKLC